MTGASMVVPFMVVFAIGVAEGPKTIPDDVKSPPLRAADPELWLDNPLAAEDVDEMLWEVEVTTTLPRRGIF